MICTCSRRTFGVPTLTYLRTCGPRASMRWATASSERNNAATETRRSQRAFIQCPEYWLLTLVIDLADGLRHDFRLIKLKIGVPALIDENLFGVGRQSE